MSVPGTDLYKAVQLPLISNGNMEEVDKRLALSRGESHEDSVNISDYSALYATVRLEPDEVEELFYNTPPDEIKRVKNELHNIKWNMISSKSETEEEVENLSEKVEVLTKVMQRNREKKIKEVGESGVSRGVFEP